MASLSFSGPIFYEFEGEGLQPGESHGVFLYGFGISHQVVVSMTASPYPVVSSAVSSLSSGDVAITREPYPSGDEVIYAGMYIKNIGNKPIRLATVWVSVVGF